MPHFMFVLMLYINVLNLSLIKTMSIFEEYGAFKEGNTISYLHYTGIQTKHPLV